MSDKFSVKTDPKLVEAQRARKAAQHASATTKEETQDDEVQSEINKVGFEKFWEGLKNNMA